MHSTGPPTGTRSIGWHASSRSMVPPFPARRGRRNLNVADRRLGAERAGLLEKRVGFVEGGNCFKGSEDLAGLSEDGCSLGRLAKCREAAASAEEGERLLGDHPETPPALRGVAVAV